MNRTIALVVLLLSMLAANSDNANAQQSCGALNSNPQFPIEWFLELKEPRYCPAAVFEGKLYDKDGRVFCTFDENNQLTKQFKVPYKVSITWLSYPEKQFYETTFPLPGDSIVALLKSGSGYEESDKNDIIAFDHIYQPYRFKDIRFLLFIGGNISVKMRSDFNIIEVAQAKAKKIETPGAYYWFMGKEDKRKPIDLINDYYSSASEINKRSLKILHKYDVKGLERLYSPLMYDYNIVVKQIDGVLKLARVQTNYLNGDIRLYQQEDLNHLKDTISRGVLQFIYLTFEQGKSVEVMIEREYIARFFEENLRTSMSLVVEWNEVQRKVEVYLTDGNHSIYVPEDKLRYTFQNENYNSVSNYAIGAPDREKYER